MTKKGQFVISLDFELHWGVFDKVELDDLGREKFIKTREVVIPELLSLFSKYNIQVTWATVGFLFARSLHELESFFPMVKPQYENERLNPYAIFTGNFPGNSETENPYHFAYSLIKEIQHNGRHEIASHSFSHFYCLEPNTSIEAFELDIVSAVSIARKNFNVDLKSFVFPRNQFNEAFLSILKKHGFKVVRSNPKHWSWSSNGEGIDALKRLFRISDTYLALRRHGESDTVNDFGLIENEGTRFLRPYSSKLKMLESLKVHRIKKEMTQKAQKGQSYHLWWHPHNFAQNTKENLGQLEDLLTHFQNLHTRYGFENLTMKDLKQ
jgi:peptidoglycan/xylan/chitin deacetylase (PgdA/CDA1 family)